MPEQKLNRPSRIDLANVQHDFRKRDDGVWERRERGATGWKTLHVEHGALTKRQLQQARRQRDRAAENGQAATSANEWTWR